MSPRSTTCRSAHGRRPGARRPTASSERARGADDAQRRRRPAAVRPREQADDGGERRQPAAAARGQDGSTRWLGASRSPSARRRRRCRRRRRGAVAARRGRAARRRRRCRGAVDRRTIASPTPISAAARAIDEQGQRLAGVQRVAAASQTSKRDEVQVDGVEHQLDRHQHQDRVAAGERRRRRRCTNSSAASDGGIAEVHQRPPPVRAAGSADSPSADVGAGHARSRRPARRAAAPRAPRTAAPRCGTAAAPMASR